MRNDTAAELKKNTQGAKPLPQNEPRSSTGRFVWLCVLILIWTGLVALVVFFISVRGAEQTLVPNVQGKQLTDALLELQVKELYPRIQLRYSSTAGDRGTILEQDPEAGTIVKAGRRIRLVVSRGMAVSAVDNYVGRKLNEVRISVQEAAAAQGGSNAGSAPLLSVKDPVMYQFSKEAAGTILEQSPKPGTTVSGPTVLSFVVSKGPQTALAAVPGVTGLSAAAAAAALNKAGLCFNWTMSVKVGGKPETVQTQMPAAGADVQPQSVVELTWNPPVDLAGGEVAQIFRYTIPENPYPLPVTLSAVKPDGTQVTLGTTRMQSGEFSFPYRLPRESTLILTMMNKEIHREKVQ
jgi:beta-lactam-binding protein with PASTA domain